MSAKKYEVAGVGYVQVDHEGSLLQLLGADRRCEWFTPGCLRDVGVEVLDPSQASAFEGLPADARDPAVARVDPVFADDPDWARRDAAAKAEDRAAYAAKTGRAAPRLYRFRVVVEAEELPEAEARAAWEALGSATLRTRKEPPVDG